MALVSDAKGNLSITIRLGYGPLPPALYPCVVLFELAISSRIACKSRTSVEFPVVENGNFCTVFVPGHGENPPVAYPWVSLLFPPVLALRTVRSPWSVEVTGDAANGNLSITLMGHMVLGHKQ